MQYFKHSTYGPASMFVKLLPGSYLFRLRCPHHSLHVYNAVNKQSHGANKHGTGSVFAYPKIVLFTDMSSSKHPLPVLVKCV